MQITVPTMSGIDAFLAAFRLRTEAAGFAEPVWLATQRRQAIERFQDVGFPTVQEEDWRYTNVSPIAATPFQLSSDAAPPTCAVPPLWNSPGDRLVFVNGTFVPSQSQHTSLPEGVVVGNLQSLLMDPRWADTFRVYLGRTMQSGSHGFAALNAALWQDGACVIIPAGVSLSAPIHLAHLAHANQDALASHPRTLVVCERDSHATIVETYHSIGDGVGLSNAVTEVIAGENSAVDLYKSVHSNSRSFHIGLLNVYAARNAQIAAFSTSLGGDLVRNEVHVSLDAEGADCTLNGLYAAHGVEHVDNHTTIDHAKPNGSSRQFYNGILDGHSTGVFNGRVIVRENAQKTDAVQKNRNLLLSTDATIDTKPQLEISANDVRCTHGATVGQLDQEALFFLRARGLDRRTAVGMLVQAFASEILDKVKLSSYREWLTHEMTNQLIGAPAAMKG